MSKRGRPPKQSAIRPVAPFNKDVRQAARSAFDRGTGNAVKANTLATYAEALAQYHLRSETKFLNGEYCNRGRTERRHVVALQIVHIGKEANKWEEQYFLGPDDQAEIEYGVDQTAGDLDSRLRDLCHELGEREAARKLEISRTALRRAMRLGVEATSQVIRGRMAAKLMEDAMKSKAKAPPVFQLRDVEEMEDAMHIREQLNRIRVFLVLTGTNRMSGRDAASQMARASWASDLPRLTNGFT